MIWRGCPSRLREGGPQRFVASNKFLDAPAQSRLIERTVQAHAGRNVVRGCAGGQLIEKPHPLLRKRQRQGRPRAAFVITQSFPLLEPASRLPASFMIASAKRGNRRPLKYLPQRQRDLKQGLDSRHQLCGQQRMAAQFEKVVVHPDIFDDAGFRPRYQPTSAPWNFAGQDTRRSIRPCWHGCRRRHGALDDRPFHSPSAEELPAR